MRVGMPQAFFYHLLTPFWTVLLQELGAELYHSPQTQKTILEKGIALACNETCLPMKACYGHVSSLVGEDLDAIFLPRVVSLHKGTYICPKFMGLPDMMRVPFPSQKWISPTIDLRRSPRSGLRQATDQVGEALGKGRSQVRAALHRAQKAQAQAKAEWAQGRTFWDPPMQQKNGLKVALLGHPYLIYDSGLSMGLLGRLREAGCQVLTPEMLQTHDLTRLRKPIFWSSAQEMANCAFRAQDWGAQGIVYLTAFGCGVDSIICEIIERQVNRVEKIPFLKISLDEHTGEAGVITRMEAFLDMLEWRVAR